jgi:hypothetical protein
MEYTKMQFIDDCLCGLVVKDNYRSQRSWFKFPALPDFLRERERERERVRRGEGLERGPLSLLSTTEELLGRNNSGSGLQTVLTILYGYPKVILQFRLHLTVFKLLYV